MRGACLKPCLFWMHPLWIANIVCGSLCSKFQSTVLQVAAFTCIAIYGHMVSAEQNKIQHFDRSAG